MRDSNNQGNVEATSFDGFIRLSQIIGTKGNPARNIPAIQPIIPISKTSFLNGVKAGIFPKPVRLGERTVAWRVSDIKRLIEQQS
ncbi:MAG: AlpA family phage regulatory protein [Syntrophobacterales bacterium]|nr:AlpA family phage regulatory protein [Syntrophobacterales bacterium]